VVRDILTGGERVDSRGWAERLGQDPETAGWSDAEVGEEDMQIWWDANRA
jgi:hypothetical protein